MVYQHFFNLICCTKTKRWLNFEFFCELANESPEYASNTPGPINNISLVYYYIFFTWQCKLS